MNHNDHVRLLRGGVQGRVDHEGFEEPGGVWADLGSGGGAFTLALADLLGPTGEIYSVDRDQGALREQERAMRSRFPATTVHYITADFTQRLDLPPLDGIVMANSLHFQREKDPVLQLVRSYLRPGGRLVLVEYNVDQGNRWVPYPLSYGTWEALARKNGFASTTLLTTQPSSWLGEMFSALSVR